MVTPQALTAIKSLLGKNAKCPECQARNQLTLSSDGWVTCKSCSFAGDIIDTGAALWKCDLQASLQRLDTDYNLKLSQSLRAAEQRQIWRQFFELPREQPPTGMRRRFLGSDVKWSAGICLITDARPLAKSLRKILVPPNRDDPVALIIPFYSQPGRVCGLLLYFTVDGVPDDGVYLSFDKNGDAGLCLLPRIVERPVEFVFTNPLTAIAAEFRWRNNHQAGLPIAGCWFDSECRSSPAAINAGNLNSSRTLIADASQDENIRFSCVFEAPVASDNRLSPTVGTEFPWLRRLSIERTRWPVLLARRWQESADDAASLLRLLPREEVVKALPDLPRHISTTYKNIKQQSAASVEGCHIVATPKGWRTVHKKQFVCDHNILIDQIVSSDNQAYYRGRVFNKEQSTSFTIVATAVDRSGLLVAVRDYLRRLPVPREMVFSLHWNTRSWSIAYELQTPEILKAASNVGWQPSLRRFQLANFFIDNDGEIQQETCLPDNAGMPTAALSVVRKFPKLPESVLQSKGFWLLAAVLIRHIIRPVWQVRAGVTVVSTEDIAECRDLLLLLGCAAVADWRHSWPFFCADKSLLEHQPDNHIFVGDDLTGWVGAAFGAERLSVAGLPEIRTADLRHTCSQIIPAYLSYFCKTQQLLPEQLTTQAEVVASLGEWLRSSQGWCPPRLVPRTHVCDRVEARLRAVHQLWQQGPSSVVSDYSKTRKVIWFSGEMILKELYRRNLPAIPLGKLRQAFETCGGYAGEVPASSSLECGVYVDWWKKFACDNVVAGRTRFGLLG